jgi:hypothetical protein
MLNSDKLEFERGAAAKTEGEDRNNGNRDGRGTPIGIIAVHEKIDAKLDERPLVIGAPLPVAAADLDLQDRIDLRLGLKSTFQSREANGIADSRNMKHGARRRETRLRA